MTGRQYSPGWRSETGTANRTDSSTEWQRTADRASSRLLVSAVSFWVAIALPALYLPLLLRGLEGVGGLWLFLTLVGFHVLALIGGRHHD